MGVKYGLRSLSGNLAAAPALRSIFAPPLKNQGATITPGAVNRAARVTQIRTTPQTALLGRTGPRGAAIAGDDLAPIIVINTDHPMNRAESGRRFTMAHELCHLLHDRDRARRVTHSSTPWAPASVEQRANAFAAMLLMPPALVRRALAGAVRPISLNHAVTAARFMNVGIHAAIRHFANVGEITNEDRDWLLLELEAGVA